MNAQDFTYWLNGFAELSGDAPPTAEQWKSIKEHLALVFVKVTPAYGLKDIQPLRTPDDLLRKLQEAPQVAAQRHWPKAQVTC